MWRIDGVEYYRVLLFIYIFFQLILIFTISVLMALIPINTSIQSHIPLVLTVMIIVIVLMLTCMVGYVAFFHKLSERKDAYIDAKHRAWLEKWTQAYFAKQPPESVTVDIISARALLELIEVLPPAESPLLLQWAEEYGIVEFWVTRLQSSNSYSQLDALEALATLGDVTHLPQIFAMAFKAPQLRQVGAVLTIGSLIPLLPKDIQYDWIVQLSQALITTDLPAAVIESVIAQLDDRISTMVDILLEHDEIPTQVLIATINTIGHFYLANYLDRMVQFITHTDPLIRKTILKAFSTLKSIPNESYNHIIKQIYDEDASVREQAIMTLSTISLPYTRLALWLALGDNEWSVRFAAAQVLRDTYGEQGIQTLQIATLQHKQLVGRQLAADMLRSR